MYGDAVGYSGPERLWLSSARAPYTYTPEEDVIGPR